ncbi:YdeI/OmpD-associated family protein [Chitinophaga alhagiae]|uniref:YdeI/OmpD-associated family protein n=1 Tax=Chitinophaga alhagiae TaxID=2203219 RepID=UPI000E5B3C21|nr:YdeI/OmpD-associated family protein [Chitinophaga alhagiae]
MENKDLATYCPTTRQQWRRWLEKNHGKKQSVWLIYYKKEAAVPTITYADAVDEALCFGWIDSTKKPHGNGSFMQLFTRRKATSVWSKINKGKVERLIAEGLMTAAGRKSIETAQQNGYWSILDDVEELVVPKDLAKAFRAHPGSKAYFTGLSKSVKKMMLQWVTLAKRPETRQKRINEIASLAAQHRKPKQF